MHTLNKQAVLKSGKTLIFPLVAAMMLAGCGSTEEIDPLYGNDKAAQVTVNETTVDDTIVTDGQKAEATEIIKQLMTDYVYRVYNINDDTPEADYIDENTTPKEWYGIVRGYQMKCTITDDVISDVTIDFKSDSASGLIIITAQYKDSSNEEGMYYIPLYVYLEKIDDEWKVVESESPYVASADEYSLVKDEAAGMYKLSPRQ